MRRLRMCTPLCLVLVYVGVARGDAGLLQVTEFRNQSLEAYPEIANRVVAGWTIPGLDAGFVPQGIAMIPDTDLVLLSGSSWRH